MNHDIVVEIVGEALDEFDEAIVFGDKGGERVKFALCITDRLRHLCLRLPGLLGVRQEDIGVTVPFICSLLLPMDFHQKP